MNLAEIRKKAERAKTTSPVVEPVPELEAQVAAGEPEDALTPVTEDEPEQAAVPFTAVEPEPVLAPFAADDELFVTDGEAFDFSSELTIDQEEPSYPEEFQLPAAPEVYTPAVNAVPDAKAQQRLDRAEKAASLPPSPGAMPVSSGYNPLATILAGREEAADVDEAAAFQQMSFAAGDVEEYLCFRVADEEYALNIMSIKEIIKPRDVTEVPRMPNFISGVISLRGVIIPVMDMRLRLSLPVRGGTGRERIIVLRTEAGFCGVLVDEVVQVARVKKVDIEAPPAVLEEIDRDFVRGLGHFDNRMLILLNLEAITDISVH